jgi:hypothetical protein
MGPVIRMKSGLGCPEEGWSWWLSDREESLYKEVKRSMRMETHFGPGGTALAEGTRYNAVYISKKWWVWEGNPQDGHFVPATPEERLLVLSRMKAVMEYFGQPECQLVLE